MSEDLHQTRLVVNGVQHTVSVPARRLLADCLRHDLGLTGTHVGCEHGVCGACTVLVDGLPMRSCLLFAVSVDGAEITTTEGCRSADGGLGPVQRAFMECHGLQCGFCTPGFVTTVTAFLRDHPDPTEAEAREAIGGNLCRCTGYQNIVASVLRAAELAQPEGSGEPQGGAPVTRPEGSGEPQGGAPVNRLEGSGEPQGGAPVNRPDPEEEAPPEVFPLLLFALTGMVLLAAASDLLVVFIALEILSLSLYVMAGATRRLPAEEAAMKYFLLGAFSSAFLLYGIALCYGAAGTTNLVGIARASVDPTRGGTLLLAGTGLLAVGFFFKVAAVPFHMWTPDVYQGAPTPVTAFMAAGTKAAGFAVFLRVFDGALGGMVVSWRPVVSAVAVVTMLVGAGLAIVQSDLKRMLAYSSISHAGYLLVGVAAAATVPAGISASLFYLLAYAFMVMGAFMVVQYASRLGPPDPEPGDTGERSNLDDYRGFARRHPWVGGLLAVFMLALTGIPPLSGFWAKYYVFLAGINAGLTWLVVVAVISSAISAFFYLRVLVVAYLQEPTGEAEPAAGRVPALGLALGLAGLLTVAIGLAPEALVSAAQTAERILG